MDGCWLSKAAVKGKIDGGFDKILPARKEAPMSHLIAAIATPPGTGGVGILRLSGPGAIQAAGQVFRPKGPLSLDQAPDQIGRAHV